MIDFCDKDTPHKKKKDQKSKSNKRSNHKHQYEKVIVKGFISWQWAEQCTICGRIKYNCRILDKEFIKPEFRQSAYISQRICYSQEELTQLYPNIKIINADF